MYVRPIKRPLEVLLMATRWWRCVHDGSGQRRIGLCVLEALQVEREARWEAVRSQKLGEFAAEFDQVGSVLFCVRRGGTAKQVASALGNRGQEIGEKVVAHGSAYSTMSVCVVDLI